MKMRIVSPDWISLYYKLEEGTFDKIDWDRLNESERDFMAYVCKHMGFDSKELNLAIAHTYRATFDRLASIEGMVKAGNINSQTVTEYKEILDRLGSSGQLIMHKVSYLKKCMDRTYERVKKDNEAVLATKDTF
jgi:hypothetical protein